MIVLPAAPARQEKPRDLVREAWDEYLEETRDLHPYRYDEIEPMAWLKLEARLRAIKLRQLDSGQGGAR